MRATLVAAVLAAAPAVAAAQPEVSLEVAPKRGTVTDNFTVTVEVKVAGVAGPDAYVAPIMTGFELLDSKRHESRAISRDPNRPSLVATHIHVYSIRPKREGRYVIGPAKIRYRGAEYRSGRAQVLVYESKTQMPSGGTTDDPIAAGVGAPGFTAPVVEGQPDAFLHTVIDKKDPYVGEQVTVTWLLYTQTEALKFDPRPPRLDNLWSEVLFEPDKFLRYHDARVNGVHYLVTPLAKRALFPTRSGPVAIEPLEANIATLRSPMGKTSVLEAPAVKLSVKPLPASAPPGFDPSYVGVFDIEAVLDRTSIDADEALILELVVRAEGAIRRSAPPKLSLPGFNFREPRDFTEEVDTKTDIVRGARTYRYWATPEKGGPQTLPAIQIPFFNPRSERYEVAATRPIPIDVRGEPTAATGAGAGRDRLFDRDIRLIREGSSVSSRAAARWYSSAWFWILSLLPMLGYAGVVITDRVLQRLRRETPRARLRRARGRARQRFRVAEIHIRGNRPAKFFGELAHILNDYLAERVGEPVQSMTRDELGEYLKKRGFATNTVTRLLKDLDAFDMARFAPSATAPEDMRAALRRVKALLREIERARIDELDDAGEDES
jgi:hypothetical protein